MTNNNTEKNWAFFIVFNFGGWGGISILYKGYSLRIALGFMSIIIMPRDIEYVLDEYCKMGAIIQEKKE